MFNVLVIGPIQLNWEEIKQSLPDNAGTLSITVKSSMSEIAALPESPDYDLILFDSSLGLNDLKVLSKRIERIPIIYYSDSLDDAMTAMRIAIDDFVVPSSFASSEI